MVSSGLLHAHELEEHSCPTLQARLHTPQWSELVVVSTQVDPHGVRPSGQPHVPPLQTCAPGHAVSQARQWARSVWRLTHAEPQRESGAGHGSVSAMQLVPAQICPAPQALPQLPQFCAVFVATHASPHGAVPLGHSQSPSLQMAPAGHGLSQAPQ
jgi:hypothetical protein